MQKHKENTIRFAANYNNKLYNKYFTTIRKDTHFAQVGQIVDVELNGKGVMLAQVKEVETHLFSKIPQALIMCDTGLNYADSLLLFSSLQIEVTKPTTKVKIILLEAVSYDINELKERIKKANQAN